MILKLFLVAAICHTVAGHKILFVNLFASTSHLMPQAALAQDLLDRGHEITFILVKKFSVIPPKAQLIILPDVPYNISVILNSANTSVFENMKKVKNIMVNICDVVSSSKLFADHLRKVKYDVMIFSTMFQQCAVITALHYQKDVPFIMYHPGMPMSAWLVFSTGVNHWDSAYAPMPFTTSTENMNFWQRFKNLIFKYAAIGMMQFMLKPMNEILSKNLGPGHKDVFEVQNDASFLFINSNFEYEYPVPVTPDVVMTGCMQCRDGRPLPKILRDFIDKYKKEGIIVFSLGSVLSSSVLDKSVINNLAEAFKEMHQGVIWHSDLVMKNLPKNILVQSWLPMQDVLADPSTKIMISHGGYMTLQETIYHGVTYLGLPTMGKQSDRSRNVRLAAYRGIGLYFDEDANRTKSLILDKLNRLLHDSTFRIKAQHYSGLMKNQLMSPRDLAVYKTEYVIRHKGASHFKCYARNLSIVQYYMLDVISLLVVSGLVAIVVFYGTVKLLWKILRLICGGSSKKVKNQ